MSDGPDAGNDRFLDLCERFTARGAELRPGNLHVDMLKHLLDAQEETETTVRAIEDKLRKLREQLGDG